MKTIREMRAAWLYRKWKRSKCEQAFATWLVERAAKDKAERDWVLRHLGGKPKGKQMQFNGESMSMNGGNNG